MNPEGSVALGTAPKKIGSNTLPGKEAAASVGEPTGIKMVASHASILPM